MLLGTCIRGGRGIATRGPAARDPQPVDTSSHPPHLARGPPRSEIALAYAGHCTFHVERVTPTTAARTFAQSATHPYRTFTVQRGTFTAPIRAFPNRAISIPLRRVHRHQRPGQAAVGGLEDGVVIPDSPAGGAVKKLDGVQIVCARGLEDLP